MKNIPILYENEEILVINKPKGLCSQGGSGVLHSVDVDLPLQIGKPVFLVHRLDKDTDGLMIVAKSSVAASKWIKLIGGKLVQKEYRALCVGSLPSQKGKITTSVVQHGSEKPAVTHYFVENQESFTFEEKSYTLSTVHLKLETGRMHQIRIHLAKINCPIAGDDKHGNFKINKILKKQKGIKNLCLTSCKLSFPVNGKTLVFEI